MTNAKDRSNRMKNLFANVDRAELEKHIPSPAADKSKPHAAGMSGAVKSMQQTFSAVEAENERLRAQLQSAEVAVELDPAHIIPAFVRDRMDFDTEIAVHLHWRGAPFVTQPTRVVYPEGNVSNFDLWKDNVRISWMHTRLLLQMPVRAPLRMLRRR